MDAPVETHVTPPGETPSEIPPETPADLSAETPLGTPVEIPMLTTIETPGEPPLKTHKETQPKKKMGKCCLILGVLMVVALALLGVGGFLGYRVYIHNQEARLVSQAKEALASGDFASAEKDANEALSLTPEGFLQQKNAAINLRGRSLAAQQRYAEALPDLETAITLDPQNAELLALRGWAYLSEGQTEKGMADLRASLVIDPNQPALLDTQARFALQNGDLETARVAAMAAGKLDEKLSLPYAFEAETLYASYKFSETIATASQSIQLQDPPAFAYRLRGGAYFWLYDFEKAKPDLEKALQLDPKDAEAAALLALLASETNDVFNLNAASDQAAAINPEGVPGLLAQAAYDLYFYQYSQARSLLDRAIKLAPERPELYVLRSYTYTSTVDDPYVKADVEKALSLVPTLRLSRRAQADWMWYMDEWDELEKIGQGLVDDFPAGEDGYIYLNGVNNARYEFTKALEIIEKGLAAAGDSSNLYTSRGDTYERMGKTEEAINDYEKALGLQPNNCYLLRSLGRLAFLNGERDAALERYNQALKIYPDNVYAYLGRSYIDFNGDQGKADLQRAAELDAQNPDVMLAQAYLLNDEGLYSSALLKLDALLERFPKFSAARNLRGWVYYALDSDAKARSEAEESLKIIPKDPETHWLLAVIEISEGNNDKALAEVDQVLAIQPQNASAYSLQGDSYWNQGEMDKAEKSYQKAVEIDPEQHESYVALAEVHINQGKYDQAVDELEEALKGGSNPIAEILLQSLETLPEGFKLQFHLDYNFILGVPEDAMPKDVPDNSAVVMLFSYYTLDQYYNIIVSYFDGETGETHDPRSFASEYNNWAVQEFPSFKTSELNDFEALNSTGVKQTYHFTIQNPGKNLPIAGNMYFFSAEGRDMVIECATLANMLPEFDDLFDQISGTFAFLP